MEPLRVGVMEGVPESGLVDPKNPEADEDGVGIGRGKPPKVAAALKKSGLGPGGPKRPAPVVGPAGGNPRGPHELIRAGEAAG